MTSVFICRGCMRAEFEGSNIDASSFNVNVGIYFGYLCLHRVTYTSAVVSVLVMNVMYVVDQNIRNLLLKKSLAKYSRTDILQVY